MWTHRPLALLGEYLALGDVHSVPGHGELQLSLPRLPARMLIASGGCVERHVFSSALTSYRKKRLQCFKFRSEVKTPIVFGKAFLYEGLEFYKVLLLLKYQKWVVANWNKAEIKYNNLSLKH